MAPIKTISPDGSRKKGRIPAPSLPGFLKTSAERVTLVYEGGTRNVKKKQWVEETTVPFYWGWWWFADWNKPQRERATSLLSSSTWIFGGQFFQFCRQQT